MGTFSVGTFGAFSVGIYKQIIMHHDLSLTGANIRARKKFMTPKCVAGRTRTQHVEIVYDSGAETVSITIQRSSPPAMAENALFFAWSVTGHGPNRSSFAFRRAAGLTSDAGILVLAEIEKRLAIAERLAACLGRSRARPTASSHGLAEMIRLSAC